MAVTSRRPSSDHSFSVWMSSIRGSNSMPRGSTVPEASPQNMKASSGSALKPTRTSMAPEHRRVNWGDVAGAADRGDPALPARDLQARTDERASVGDGARPGAGSLGRVDQRNGQEARRAW